LTLLSKSPSSFSIKKEYPKISVVTPSYNQGHFIEETIQSVVYQDYPNIEYIIIDGGSKDQSLAIIHKYENQISYWVSEIDAGQTDAINKGLLKVTGDIIAYLNSDDLYTPNAIRIAIDFFKTHPDIDMIYGDIIHIDEHSDFINLQKTGKILLENYLNCQTYLPQPTVFFRKRVIEKIGYFDETLHLAMDLDYWIRIFLNFQTEYIPSAYAKARIYPTAKSSADSLNYLKERLYILDKTFSNEYLLKTYFKSDEKVKKLKIKTYSAVHFFGGLEYLRHRQLNIAYSHIMKGIKLYPRHFWNPNLYWSIFVAVIGERFSKKITGFLPIRMKTNSFFRY
jgi:glycosyltransferase involved in cell wall biosynthesis